MLRKLTGHLLSSLFLLKIGALLCGAVTSKAIDVDVVGLQLLHQLCNKDNRSDVVKGDDEDMTAIGNAAKPIVVQSFIEELPERDL